MGKWERPNLLCRGDNLSLLADPAVFADACVDLIYLDPPFNTRQSYNALFRGPAGARSAARVRAFQDIWKWDASAGEALRRLRDDPAAPPPLADLMRTFLGLLGRSPMMAYLAQMAVRLVHMHRVLKPTGCLYLHCDPTAGHYLKCVLDALFGAGSFLNEIIWKRSSAHSDVKHGMRRCGRIHDVLLLYAKGPTYTWNPQYTPYAAEYVESEYRHVSEDGRRYKETDATAAHGGADGEYEWHVKRPKGKGRRWQADPAEEYKRPKRGFEYRTVRCYRGRYWAYSKAGMLRLARAGRLIHRETGMPRIVQYADEMPGVPAQDVWTDIAPAVGRESMGYPTQKPLALLQRVVAASSNPGDVVLDPFCGCGTTIDAVETLNRADPAGRPRRWIGIDSSHLAVNLVKHRLTRFDPPAGYEVAGEPADSAEAKALAREEPLQFQYWALGLMGARPVAPRRQRSGDSGMGGVRVLPGSRGGRSGAGSRVLVQVKTGRVAPGDVRDLAGMCVREKAEMGVYLTLERPSKPARAAAERACPKVQILTIGELLEDSAAAKVARESMTAPAG